MNDESKPPMRQIAELIDGIATARAESAERLLGECEVQLIEARFGVKTALEAVADRDAEIARLKVAVDSESTLRSYREEQLRLLHQDYAGCVGERNAATIERDNADAAVTAWQWEVESRDTQITNLTGWLDAAKAEASQARHEVETWQREYSGALADFEHAQAEIARLKAELDETRADLAGLQCAVLVTPEQRGGYVTTAAPPAEDPRIAALVKPLCIVVTALVNHTWKRETDEGLSGSVCKAIAQIAWRE